MHATESRRIQISSSAALGLGIAMGVIIVLLVFLLALVFYYRLKMRRSQMSKPDQEAKKWKGFTPATPSTGKRTSMEGQMANNYFVELPTPVTPAYMLSPPLGETFGTGFTWGMDYTPSWQRYGPVSPIAPGSPAIELPV